MMRFRDTGGVPREIAGVRFRDQDNVSRECFVNFRDATNSPKTVFAPVTNASVSPETAYGQIASRRVAPITTDSVEASAPGGPYVCVWSRVDANPQAWTILSPNSAETSFRANSVNPGEYQEAQFVATLTANGRSIVTPIVSATAENLGYDDGGIPL